jgi:hypothetical protein
MLRKCQYYALLISLLLVTLAGVSAAADEATINTGVDFYSRYVWRGLDVAATPSIQPSFSIAGGGFEFGIWGAYTLSNETSGSDEIDFWLSYTMEMESGVSFQLIGTDYYYPNAGIDFFNFNDYDAVINDTIPDPGAHTIELGASVTGPASAPITVSGFVNVYNDGGNNTYLQVDYPVTVNGTELGFFCGVAGGSEKNPDYYGADKVSAINVGVSASREIKVSETFSLPLNMSFIVNPKAEISHLVVGMSF